jgi:ABC-type amino acid transport substrate-binding protein
MRTCCLILISAACCLGAVENLFGELAGVQLWYPPYASKQPVMTEDGFTVDLAGAHGKAMATVQIPLPEGLESGSDYLLGFEARCEGKSALIVLVPEAMADGSIEPKSGKARANSHWEQHGTRFKQRRIEFTYDPATVIGKQIQFFWNGEKIGADEHWTFRAFSLEKL